MISCVVDEVGASNIVQVVMNDASPYMQNAWHRVLKRHGHSFFFPLCPDFCINFLLGKIAALGHISEVPMKAKEITRFIRGNEMPVKLVGNGEIVSNSCLKYVAAFDTREASFRESKSGGDV
jgi:hypothetical protein